MLIMDARDSGGWVVACAHCHWFSGPCINLSFFLLLFSYQVLASQQLRTSLLDWYFTTKLLLDYYQFTDLEAIIMNGGNRTWECSDLCMKKSSIPFGSPLDWLHD
jgi:hypothetical protein